MTWTTNKKDSLINQKYYMVNGIWTISKAKHGTWRYTLWKGNQRVGTYDTFEQAEQSRNQIL